MERSIFHPAPMHDRGAQDGPGNPMADARVATVTSGLR